MSKPANPYLRDASDRQLLCEFARREHIPTNHLLKALFKRFDAVFFAGVQEESASSTRYLVDFTGDGTPEYMALLRHAGPIIGYVPADTGAEEQTDDPPATDGEVAEDEE